MRFQIKSTAGKPEQDLDGTYLRFRGNVEPFERGCEMDVVKLGENGGEPLLQFTTGLNEKKIPYYGWLTENQKEEYKKFLEEHKPIIAEYFGGEAVIADTNKYFWTKEGRNQIKVNNETLNRVYDTRNVEHALLYANIMGGGFAEIIAPVKEMAESPSYAASLYLVHENEAEDEISNDYLTKGTAYANLTQLNMEDSGDALLYLAWVLQYKTQGFGGYTRSTPKKELLTYHGEFIEGKLTKTKRNTPKDFVELTEKWKEGGLVREAIQVEAYLKAADHYSYLNTNRENRYELPSGVVLGASIEESVGIIRKPKNNKELEALRNFVEAKWKE